MISDPRVGCCDYISHARGMVDLGMELNGMSLTMFAARLRFWKNYEGKGSTLMCVPECDPSH